MCLTNVNPHVNWWIDEPTHLTNVHTYPLTFKVCKMKSTMFIKCYVCLSECHIFVKWFRKKALQFVSKLSQFIHARNVLYLTTYIFCLTFFGRQILLDGNCYSRQILLTDIICWQTKLDDENLLDISFISSTYPNKYCYLFKQII